MNLHMKYLNKIQKPITLIEVTNYNIRAKIYVQLSIVSKVVFIQRHKTHSINLKLFPLWIFSCPLGQTL